jgi:hypothetical protein
MTDAVVERPEPRRKTTQQSAYRRSGRTAA